ncbi:MAG: hypothetical protein JNM30_05360 [Rhodospirillales bacterium]|nr:hypothetical protein [Rhodospirillales bacterium]
MAGRRKGAGRPTEGPNDNQIVPVLVRVSPKTKQRLDEERAQRAKELNRTKLSMTQMVELLVTEALDARADRKTVRGQRARALGYLMAMIAELTEKEVGRAWSTDPYTFKLLRCAIDELLGKLAPEGPLTIPASFQKELDELGPDPSDITRNMLTIPEFTAWPRVTGPLLHSLAWAQAKSADERMVGLPKLRDPDAEAAREFILGKLASALLPPIPPRSTKK